MGCPPKAGEGRVETRGRMFGFISIDSLSSVIETLLGCAVFEQGCGHSWSDPHAQALGAPICSVGKPSAAVLPAPQRSTTCSRFPGVCCVPACAIVWEPGPCCAGGCRGHWGPQSLLRGLGASGKTKLSQIRCSSLPHSAPANLGLGAILTFLLVIQHSFSITVLVTIWAGSLFAVGAVLCIVGWSAASLVSTH